jgi:methionine-rich copper-binding protein CopC
MGVTIMTARFFGSAGLAFCVLAFSLHGVLADGLHVVKSSPAQGAVVDASNSNQFEIRFDGPLDPRHSSLSITRDGQAVETLHPSLDASPGILFARGPRLAPGDYKLHWSVKSLDGTDVAEGDIAFSVKS